MVMITRRMARAEAAKSAPTVTSPPKQKKLVTKAKPKPKATTSVPMKIKMKKNKSAKSSSNSRKRKRQGTPRILSEASKFLLGRVENWKYKGWQGDQIDFAKPDCRTNIRNDIWSSLRLQFRGPFSVEVKYSENTPRVLNIEICEFLTETKTKLRFSDKVVATIQVTQVEDLSKVKWLYFTFRIVNKEIADDRLITVGKLHAVCASAFDTILVRCTGQDGDLHDAMDRDLIEIITQTKAAPEPNPEVVVHQEPLEQRDGIRIQGTSTFIRRKVVPKEPLQHRDEIQGTSTSIPKKKTTKEIKIKKEWDISDSKEVGIKTRTLMENLPYVLQLKKSGQKKKEII